jgi:hypothetical protein
MSCPGRDQVVALALKVQVCSRTTKRSTHLRVLASIDNVGCSAFIPLTGDFILA